MKQQICLYLMLCFSLSAYAQQETSTEYVDLGLPSGILWATCNLGAAKPELPGDYYAWGEIATKENFSKDNCSSRGKELGDINGNPNYDVATSTLGKKWRLPTTSEIWELKDLCQWTTKTENGIRAEVVTGPNGNQIILPFSGYKIGLKTESTDFYGSFWMSSEVNKICAGFLYYTENDLIPNMKIAFWDVSAKSKGRNIRPVIAK